MKLICEHMNSGIEVLTENDAKSGEKKFYIEGVFMQAEKKNRNGRVYKKSILESAVDAYNTNQVRTGRAVGELDHPEGPTINMDRVSHRIMELSWKGDDVIGKALVLNTPCGKIVQGLLEGGVQLGVSSRGMGSLTQQEGVSYVGNDFLLNTVDIVQDPSAHNAFVNGIMEGVEWAKDTDGIFKAKRIEEETETELMTRKLNSLRQFLSGMSQD